MDNINALSASDLMQAIAKAVETEQALGVCGQKITETNMVASQSLINQTAGNTGKMGTLSTIATVLGSVAAVVGVVSLGCSLAGVDIGASLKAVMRFADGGLQAGKGITDGISAHYEANIETEKACSDAAGKASKSASELTTSAMKQAANASKAESAVIREMTFTKAIY